MSTRPQSVNDETPIAKRIRRDQFRRISQIIDVNREFPLIALGLVRDYCKGITDVLSVSFDNPESPKEIIVRTNPDQTMGGTQYHYRINKVSLIEVPTL